MFSPLLPRLRLVDFRPFESSVNALKAVSDLLEGISGDALTSFLSSNLRNQVSSHLVVQEEKLAQDIQRRFSGLKVSSAGVDARDTSEIFRHSSPLNNI